MILDTQNISHDYTNPLASFALISMQASYGYPRWATVSGAELIKALERIINSDSRAIQMLAVRKMNPGADAQSQQ
ncbi:hypothetical protein [Microbulbifer aestuariivivens]|uniref:hypothetical protein n=1 Tax=Microbulbifer aestuariivivens TaxID=1908308 RepID=UPI0031E75D6A